MNAPTYDPNKVIAEANQKKDEGDWNGGKLLFESALLEWGDDVRESQSSQTMEALATLWLAYAQYLIQAKQYKSATDAYDEAMLSCPIARVFSEAAQYALERNRAKTAQDIYINAVKTVKDEQDIEVLWDEFLEMMKENNPSLSMEYLRAAVAKNDLSAEKSSSDTTSIAAEEPEAKKQKTEGQNTKTHVVTKDSVEQSASRINIELPEELRAAWIGRDGSFPPQRPEPSLFSPAPPKLSDPTAQDILGLDLAIEVTERLLSPSGTLVLEACRALWSLQALKEQEAKSKVDSIQNKLIQQHGQLEQEHEARLSVAEGNLEAAVQQMNESEMQQFRQTAEQQRQAVLNENAWELRKLLCGQQTILAKLNVPCFVDGPTVDAHVLQQQAELCKYLHSAFYIRSKMGPGPHGAMLATQLKKLKNRSSSSPKMAGTSSPMPPSARLSPIPPSYGNNGGRSMGVHSIPQHGGAMSAQQQPALQPILGPPSSYGYLGGAPMMMHQQPGMAPPPPPMNPQFPGQQQQPYPNHPQQPPPPYGGQQQQHYPPYYR